MIINIRGTNGSGKSTVVREVMALSDPPARPIYGALGSCTPEAYELRLPGAARPVFVLGPYLTATGGCDAVHPFDLILELLEKYAPRGHVLFEGLIVGKLWGRMGALLEDLAPTHGVALLYLTTPLEECIRRVVARRRAAGDLRPFSEKNLRAVYDQVRANLVAVRKKGIPNLRIEEVSSEEAPARVLQILRSA